MPLPTVMPPEYQARYARLQAMVEDAAKAAVRTERAQVGMEMDPCPRLSRSVMPTIEPTTQGVLSAPVPTRGPPGGGSTDQMRQSILSGSQGLMSRFNPHAGAMPSANMGMHQPRGPMDMASRPAFQGHRPDPAANAQAARRARRDDISPLGRNKNTAGLGMHQGLAGVPQPQCAERPLEAWQREMGVLAARHNMPGAGAPSSAAPSAAAPNAVPLHLLKTMGAELHGGGKKKPLQIPQQQQQGVFDAAALQAQMQRMQNGGGGSPHAVPVPLSHDEAAGFLLGLSPGGLKGLPMQKNISDLSMPGSNSLLETSDVTASGEALQGLTSHDASFKRLAGGGGRSGSGSGSHSRGEGSSSTDETEDLQALPLTRTECSGLSISCCLSLLEEPGSPGAEEYFASRGEMGVSA